MNEVVDPLHGIPVLYCLSCGPLLLFSNVSSASLIIQSGGNAIALLPQSTLTHGLQWTQLPNPGLEEPPSGQSLKLLK